MNDDEILENTVSVREAAALLGVSEHTADNHARDGRLKTVKCSRGGSHGGHERRVLIDALPEFARPKTVTVSGIKFPGWVRGELARRRAMLEAAK